MINQHLFLSIIESICGVASAYAADDGDERGWPLTIAFLLMALLDLVAGIAQDVYALDPFFLTPLSTLG